VSTYLPLTSQGTHTPRPRADSQTRQRGSTTRTFRQQNCAPLHAEVAPPPPSRATRSRLSPPPSDTRWKPRSSNAAFLHPRHVARRPCVTLGAERRAVRICTRCAACANNIKHVHQALLLLQIRTTCSPSRRRHATAAVTRGKRKVRAGPGDKFKNAACCGASWVGRPGRGRGQVWLVAHGTGGVSCSKVWALHVIRRADTKTETDADHSLPTAYDMRAVIFFSFSFNHRFS